MNKPTRVLIFIVSYQAEAFLSKVLQRIPVSLLQDPAYQVEILVIDDQSADATFEVGQRYADLHPGLNLRVLYNPVNQGYGGNQKIGYHYAVKNNFDIVVLLHGDGQYAPEYLPQMLAPFADGAECVLGSRMLKRSDALKGGMPLYKWVGNQILTRLQNWLLGCNLAEFHTGYRAYRVQTLAELPFQANANYFDFDTDILIQLLDTQRKIVEIAIPTFYGDEISRVNGIKYGGLILRTTLLSRIARFGIFYDPKFDYLADNTQYTLKLGYPSSHEFALRHTRPAKRVLDITHQPDLLAPTLRAQGKTVIALADLSPSKPPAQPEDPTHSQALPQAVDCILMLDQLELQKDPEKLLAEIRARYGAQSPACVITSANVAFAFVRLSHLLGNFNYSKKGILDLNHLRMFTYASLRRLLQNAGYEVLHQEAIPAPFPLAFGERRFAYWLTALNQWLCRVPFLRGWAAYQIGIVARPLPTLEHLLERAQSASAERRQRMEP